MKKIVRKIVYEKKSRTKARSALSHGSYFSFSRVGSFFVLVSYFFAVLILFVFFVFQFASHVERSPSMSESKWMISVAEAKIFQPTPQTVIGYPVRLKIPGIHVDAAINHVGLMPDGSMGIPKLPRDTAWYMLGPKPGQIGSAVIAGHVNWWHGAKGVFEKLNKVKTGDFITVQDDKSVTTTFIVRGIRTIGLKEDASSVFRSYDGKSHLNLVTCTGVWDKTVNAYSKRLVIFADKVE